MFVSLDPFDSHDLGFEKLNKVPVADIGLLSPRTDARLLSNSDGALVVLKDLAMKGSIGQVEVMSICFCVIDEAQ